MAAMKIVDSCGTSDTRSTALHLAVYQVYTVCNSSRIIFHSVHSKGGNL